MLELKIFVRVQTSATLVMTFLNGKCKVNINKLLVGVLTWIDLFISMFKVKILCDSSHSTAQQYSKTVLKTISKVKCTRQQPLGGNLKTLQHV